MDWMCLRCQRKGDGVTGVAISKSVAPQSSVQIIKLNEVYSTGVISLMYGNSSWLSNYFF